MPVGLPVENIRDEGQLWEAFDTAIAELRAYLVTERQLTLHVTFKLQEIKKPRILRPKKVKPKKTKTKKVKK